MSRTVWVKTAIAAESLGISVDYLLELRQSEEMKAGVHYRDVSKLNSKRPSYRWHVGNVSKLFESRSARAQ